MFFNFFRFWKIKEMELKRINSTAFATYGVLRYDKFECKTLELPDRNNQTNVSCIPLGRYKYMVVESSRSFNYPHVWIIDVPGRAGIKIHVANFVRELSGCIAVGSIFKDIDQDSILDLTDSRDTLEDLLEVIPKQGWINIKI